MLTTILNTVHIENKNIVLNETINILRVAKVQGIRVQNNIKMLVVPWIKMFWGLICCHGMVTLKVMLLKLILIRNAKLSFNSLQYEILQRPLLLKVDQNFNSFFNFKFTFCVLKFNFD